MPRSIEEQINRLKCKGMHFDDEKRAHDDLSHISYFRLKYYWKDMLDPETEEDFLSTASFDDVLKRYDFGRQVGSISAGIRGSVSFGFSRFNLLLS